EEPDTAPWPEPDPLRFTAERVVWPVDWPAEADPRPEADAPSPGATASWFPTPIGTGPRFLRDAPPAPAGEPLLPRDGWEDSIALLRALFRAKRALDQAEAESAPHGTATAQV